jgi:Domain of unknown function (DUF4349)
MNALSTRLTSLGLPAIIGVVLALALALTTGLSSLNFGWSGSSGGASTAVDKGTVSDGRLDIGAPSAVPGDIPRVDVVRYGNISLEVSDAEASLKSITELISANGGYLSSSSRYGQDDQLYVSATFRVPATSFDSVMTALREQGDVLSEDVSSYEVTMQLVDLEARLKNLRASETAFLALLDRASSVSDVVAVQAELSRIQGDIESFEAQRAALADQVAMSSINVTLQLPVSPVNNAAGNFDLGYEISNALANLINVGRAVITAAINIVVIGIPIAVIGALFGSLIGRVLTAVAAWVKKSLNGSRKGARRAARR